MREQLDRLDSLMMDETDPKRLKEYADASARLSAQEFDLSGRPKSGSRRPAVEDKRARRGAPSSIFSDGPAMVQVPVTPPPAVQPARPLGWEYDDPSAPAASITPPNTPTGSVLPISQTIPSRK